MAAKRPRGAKSTGAGQKATRAAGKLAAGTRKRDYAAEYVRRQARAKASGFDSYYAQRVRGGAKASPSAPKPSGERLARARGHRSYRDLLASIREGDLVSIDPVDSERDAQGRWKRVVVSVLDDEGDERTYTLTRPQLSDARIRELVDRISDVGAVSSPLYPLSKLLPDFVDEDLEDLADREDAA